MKSAQIFLNGYYDPRHPEFYKQEIAWGLENSHPLICADGGIWLFRSLNHTDGTQFAPDVLIGDLDSLEGMPADAIEQLQRSGMHIVREWVGKVDKDYTDGQLAVAYAVEEYASQHIVIYGGLPCPDGYETDHFLGNLKLMRFGLRAFSQGHGTSEVGHAASLPYKAEMRDVFQTIHLVISDLTLERKNAGLQRVSLVAEHPNVTAESSMNLRWKLDGLHVDSDLTNTLRNEFVAGADRATIRLADGSDPVYVIHNWYET
jgi:thiamine pyrophosphokinase